MTNAGAAALDPGPHNEDFGIAAVGVLGGIAAGLAVLLGAAH
ncbi:hypothetical protein OG746_19485 [Streptomyces sp. NBC_01016]|nr:hypothetical protein [Streptomyces sp. NBC_01016]MCX4830918.1 hypothetical protein [Streptomyces sp. NBC_01016]